MRFLSIMGSKWERYFASHFFRKAFLTYFMMAVISGIVLLIVISQNLVTIKTEQTLDMSNQIIETVDDYLMEKIISARSIHQKLIKDNANWSLITSHLKAISKDKASFPEYPQLRQVVNQTVFSVDSQFYGLFFYSNSGDDALLFVNDLNKYDRDFFIRWSRENNNEKGISLQPARADSVRNNAYPIFVFSRVSAPESFAQEIGTMGLSFSAFNIRQIYRRFDNYLKGSIQVINKSGAILYDSGAAHTLPENYPLDLIVKKGRGHFTYGNNIYNVVFSPTGEYYVVNVIPKSEVQNDVRVVQRSIQIVILVVLLFALLMTYISSNRYNRRLQNLIAAMHHVRNGNLTGHQPSPQVDELGIIHNEFLSVCDSLEDYIQREYVYQIKQKEMEFYALQAQIDPHFLYNTLEAIRMKLLLTGEREASRMIRILSDIFRNTMREDTVVDLRDEIRHLRDYLDLYKFRLGDKLKYSIDIEEDVYSYACIRHILQPIIENALIHGFRDVNIASQPGVLALSARKVGDDINFLITDNGSGIASHDLEKIIQKLESGEVFQQSIGIYNVSNRLRIIYGSAYQLQIESVPLRGTTVHLSIKAMSKKELRSIVQGTNRG